MCVWTRCDALRGGCKGSRRYQVFGLRFALALELEAEVGPFLSGRDFPPFQDAYGWKYHVQQETKRCSSGAIPGPQKYA